MLLCLLTLLVAARPAAAQATIVIARVAFKNVTTFRYAQVFHESGRWVFPDLGYVDYGNSGDYREFFAGAGRTLIRSPKATLVGEMYYLQATGEASGSARYLLPWALVAVRPTARLRGEAVYFPYVPLNEPARLQHVVDRAKLEYALPHVKFGAGYGGYQAEGIHWQHQPFVTVTVTPPRVGDIEMWVQRVPERGVQFQIRYFRVIR
jgi:hypothetical protein